jgi:LysM repeat protein
MCIQGLISSGSTGFLITSGNASMNFYGCTVSCLCKAFRWNEVWRSLSVGLVFLNLVACAGLDSISGPKMSDLQLTVDVLNGSLKDAQQAMAELRAELEVRNQELAEMQVVRAQLEGRVREAERRLSEARHVIALQREELTESRADRERIARTGTVLQTQLKQLRKQLSRIEKQQASGGVSPTIMDLQVEKQLRSVPVGMKEAISLDDPLDGRRVLSQPNGALSGAASVDQGAAPAQPLTLATNPRVVIRYGDTLWSLAQRYHTSVHQLMAVNALSTDYIQAGQSLWLPESVADESQYEGR